MKHRLTKDQIADVCRCLLHQQRRVGVRDVMRQLHQQYGVKGRTERITAILKEEAGSALPFPLVPTEASDVAALSERVRVAEERAAQAELRAVRAEELERNHQDFWANRYAERVAQMERHYAELAGRPSTGVSADQYLKVCQLNAELTRRLELYQLERAGTADRS